MKKRLVSILCVLALCLTLLPVTAQAAGGSYLALGDSITTGYAPGNTTVSSPFAGQVQAMGGYASLTNRAAEGETTQTLKDRLPGLSGDIAGASLITITIGGNDLMNALYGYLVDSYNTNNPATPITLESLKAALMDLSNPMNQLMLMGVISYIGGFDGSSAETAALDTFEANLGGIIDQIRRENPSAPIVIATQYNPYRHITDQSAQGIVAAFETGVVHLNERLTKVAGEKGLLVADVYTAFRDDGGQLTNAAFSMSDLQNASLDFHPNQAGHNKIAAVIYGALPGESRKTIMLGTSGISGWDSTNGYDYIYFGNWTAPDGNTTSGPIKWRVLDDQANNGETGLFLLSEDLLGSGSYGDVYFNNDVEYGDRVWPDSDAQAWCRNFYSSNFSAGEQSAVLGTTKSDEEFTSSTGKFVFHELENILNGDKVFFLSVEEVENSAYGFINDAARVANYGTSAGDWWLRSPLAGGSPYCAGMVDYTSGAVLFGNVYYDYAARPAFNLDLNAVLFTSAAAVGKSASGMDSGLTAVGDYDGDEWKLTLLDNSRKFAVTESTASGNPGDTITLHYSGAATGTKEYISVILADNSGPQYYGRVAQPTSANGTVNLKIPDTLADGTYTLSVFSEQYNGDYKTDYASAFAVVSLTVEDTIAPTLRGGGATRTSETNATVTFTSDEAGDYYYEVVESGETAPTIDTTGTGTSCASGANTIFLTTLSGAGAKDLYMVAKDAAGNVSDTLQIKIPEYIPPVYGISADTNVDFGTVTEGYAAPAEQTVTIRNTGNQPVTLTQPVDTASFTVGALSSAELAVGQTAAFTVRPKTGLAPGTYSETLALAGQSGTYSVGADVALRFVVEQRGGGSSGGSSSGGGGGTPTYSATVTEADHGTVTVSPKNAAKGSTVTITVMPEQGYQLDTLTVTDSQGNQLKLTGQGEGKFTFTMPGGPVTVQAVFAPIPEEPEQPLPFTDVDETAWYYDGVRYVYEKGLMTGTSAAAFSPGTTTSRSMVAAILWRMAGSPQVDYVMDYADVEQGQWYSEAVRWAASESIVGGYGNGLFGTNDPITREQLAVMLYRFAQKQGYDVSVGENTNILSYTDAAQVSEWAIPALQWACGGGLITGTGDGSTLTPQGDTTRAEAAVLLMRFCEAYVTW
ncbi:S-layer homology domain-containing protein [Flavonifractor sp. An306]|uniref:S-layer homology domain-containing protein n=1 Tax=Flavonifractor sp. An306 TaxID=1965629 RepID=UPI0017489FC1|nr:S-layer homology domain-containing protein [Flavonifractor sp. An306]